MTLREAIEELTFYKCLTTIPEEFAAADRLGIEAVRDTFTRIFAEHKKDYKYLTELVIVLNWKIWQFYEKSEELCMLYDELWNKANNYACENLKDEELSYFQSNT